MGTLFDQAPRLRCNVEFHDVEFFLTAVRDVTRKTGFEFEQVMRVFEYLQHKRRLDLMVNDFDTKDEQLSGFGQMLSEAVDKFREYVEAHTE